MLQARIDEAQEEMLVAEAAYKAARHCDVEILKAKAAEKDAKK